MVGKNLRMALALSACCAAGVPVSAAIAQGANGTGSPFELAYWQAVAGGNDPALYDAYLKQFPDGTFAAIARSRADQAPKAALPIAIAPPALPLAAASAPVQPASAPFAASAVAVASPDLAVSEPATAGPLAPALTTAATAETPVAVTAPAETPVGGTTASALTPAVDTGATSMPATTAPTLTPVTALPAASNIAASGATLPALSTPETSGPGFSLPHLPFGTPLSLLATAATAASVASAAQSAAADALIPNVAPSVTFAPKAQPVLPATTTLAAAAEGEPVLANAALVSALDNQSSIITGAAMGTGGNLAASTPVAALPEVSQPVLAAVLPSTLPTALATATPQPSWPTITAQTGPLPLAVASADPMPVLVQSGAAALRAASVALDAAAAQVTPKAVPRPAPAPVAAPPRLFRAIERSRPRRAPIILGSATPMRQPRRVLTTAATSPAMQDVGLMGGGGISPLGYMLTQLAYSQQTPGVGMGLPEEASLPMRPAFMPVPPMQVPSAFCSIDQRNAFHEGIYEPALAIAQHNNELAVAYITHLKSLYDSYQLSGDSRTIASIAAEARDFQPIASLAFSTQDNLVRAFEELMTTPISMCGAIQ